VIHVTYDGGGVERPPCHLCAERRTIDALPDGLAIDEGELSYETRVNHCM
jgi:hypothetical protein